MRSVRKRWTVCTISLLLIFYKTKEITRTEERQEAALAGDGVLSLSRSMINSSNKIIQKGGSSIFQHAAEGWKINSSLVMEIRVLRQVKNSLRLYNSFVVQRPHYKMKLEERCDEKNAVMLPQSRTSS